MYVYAKQTTCQQNKKNMAWEHLAAPHCVFNNIYVYPYLTGRAHNKRKASLAYSAS